MAIAALALFSHVCIAKAAEIKVFSAFGIMAVTCSP
jgi:hypothetical protein